MLTPAGSANALHDVGVDRLVLVDDVHRQDDADVERGELFADGRRRQLTEPVHVRRRHHDHPRPLHNNRPAIHRLTYSGLVVMGAARYGQRRALEMRTWVFVTVTNCTLE